MKQIDDINLNSKIVSKSFIDKLKRNPPLLLFFSYIVINLIGTLLLCLPISNRDFSGISFITSFFTSTSALCVTGLSTVTTLTHWTPFGHLVILILIQLGGLGIMTAASAFSILIRRRISLSDRKILSEEKNSTGVSGMVKLVRYILIATFIIEGVGTILLSLVFIPQFGLLKGLWYSIFHSISAFCNAGFDILGSNSLNDYGASIIVVLSISMLIILGGLGYRVYKDIYNKKRWGKFNLHTKLVLIVTILLLLVGWFGVALVEWNNPQTIGNMPIHLKLLHSFFQSVTTRTAGFASFNQASLRPATALLCIVLMFIGGSPSGTAGGIKTTTLAVEFLSTKSLIQGDEMQVFNRTISREIFRKASAITCISLSWLFLSSYILMITEHKPFLDILYETTSAIATVGLTRNVTSSLSIIGQLVIIATMMFGKLGPLTIFYALAKKKKVKKYKLAQEEILVG